MSLAQAVADNLPEFRRWANALMVDACTIVAPGGGTTFDPTTGQYVTSPGAIVYSGPCQVQVPSAIPQTAAAGEQLVVVERITVKIPWDAPTVPVNSVVTITASAEVSGVDIGARYRVTGNHSKTYQTSKRIPCDLVTA
jgi:hypothetical protein